jgi:MoxR-like ATPase
LKLTDFEQLPSDYAETRLELNDRDPSKTVARALNGQSSLLYVRMSDDDITVIPLASRKALTAAALQARAEAAPYNLLLDSSVYATVVAALESGKHIILTGPPGTAKTTLAQAVAETARDLGLSHGYLLTTATADWTTYETIGGLKPKADNALEFESGHFLRAIEDREWLVIDELNRSQFDRAFGQLFTVLSGQAVSLPYRRPGAEGNLTLVPEGVEPSQHAADVLEIPKDWRIVATMNVFDKSLLFEMSYALMRRFAFIEVPSPSREVFTDLIGRWAEDSVEAAGAAEDLLAVRDVKDIGPAVYCDIARFARERVGQGSVAPADLRYQAFYSYLLPQFEGITDEQGERLMRILLKIVGNGKRALVRDTLNGVLGLELQGAGEVADGLGEPVEPPDED